MTKLLVSSMLWTALVLSATACGSPNEMPTDELESGNSGAGAPVNPPDAGGPALPPDHAAYSNPVTDPDFTKLPDGRDLSSIKVSGTKLGLTRGTGSAFTASLKRDYDTLKAATKASATHKVQWTLMDLDAHRVIDRSAGADRKLFGASSSKIYVGAALLDRQNGVLSASQLQLMANMLVVSSNEAWTTLQSQVGDGDSNKGRERIHQFTQRMGYPNTRGFQGYWGKIHGNELIPDEAVELLYDLYTGAFPGAALEWKLMHTCRTGASRGLKYIPSNIYVGGKTGTYDGPTENPATGASYDVAVRNHLLVFYAGGRQYGLAILANSGTDQSAALLAGGLIREYAGVP